MKEAKDNLILKPIFRETFRSEQEVRKNGGTPTDVDFKNGVGSFNGSSSSISYDTKTLSGAFSIRVKLKTGTLDDNRALLSTNHLIHTNEFYIQNTKKFTYYNDSTVVQNSLVLSENTEYEVVYTYDGSIMTIYINGDNAQSGAISFNYNEWNDSNLQIGAYGNTFNNNFSGSIGLVEIYKGTLTPSEVANLYTGKWNKELSGMGGQSSSGNLIKNGAFDTDSDWTYNSSAVKIENGKLTKFDVSSDYIEQDINAISGKKYKVSFEITNLSGGHPSVRLSNNIVYQIEDDGIHSFDAIADGSSFRIAGNLALFSIDNVIIQELAPKTLIDFDSTNGVLEDKQVGSVVGDNLVTNGTFDTDSDWTKGTGWTISGGKATSDGTQTVFSNLYQTTLGMSVGKKYKYYFEVTGLSTGSSGSFNLGGSNGGNNFVNFSENRIYSGELTPTILTNNNLYISSDAGSSFSIDNIVLYEIRDDLAATDVAVKKIGNSYSAEFNGTTSMIDTGTDMIGTKAVTVMYWIKPYNFNNESANGTYIDNGKFSLYHNITGALRITSNLMSFPTSGLNSIILNKLQFISVTRESDGTVNFYIGDKNTAPALSGAADQNSGTPVAGTTNVIIGNNDAQTRTFDGLIPEIKVIENILSLDDITRYWSESRKNYM